MVSPTTMSLALRLRLRFSRNGEDFRQLLQPALAVVVLSATPVKGAPSPRLTPCAESVPTRRPTVRQLVQRQLGVERRCDLRGPRRPWPQQATVPSRINNASAYSFGKPTQHAQGWLRHIRCPIRSWKDRSACGRDVVPNSWRQKYRPAPYRLFPDRTVTLVVAVRCGPDLEHEHQLGL